MWKSFGSEPHGEWSEFAGEYDHSATPDNLMVWQRTGYSNEPEPDSSRLFAIDPELAGLSAQESMSALACGC
jgi:hypothetical protein